DWRCRAGCENAVKTRRAEQEVVSRPLPKNYSSRSYESSLDGAASECREKSKKSKRKLRIEEHKEKLRIEEQEKERKLRIEEQKEKLRIEEQKEKLRTEEREEKLRIEQLRKLNRKLVKDKFPLPIIEDAFGHFARSKGIFYISLRNGFFLHVDVDRVDCRKLTSFIVPDEQFEFNNVHLDQAQVQEFSATLRIKHSLVILLGKEL
ncbi:hypothetical protein TNCV_1702331, partial [Trichonephila clavipes]